MRDINKHIMDIPDEKLRYVVVRKILRLLRKNKALSMDPNGELITILKASIRNSADGDSIVAKTLETGLSERVLLFYITSILKYKQ